MPPKFPFPRPLEKLPEKDPKTLEYEKKLVEFQENRQRVVQVREDYWRALGDRKRLSLSDSMYDAQSDYFAAKVTKWNGEIFWAPASKSEDIVIKYGDEVRSVFGPIPKFDVTTLGKFTRSDGSTIETALLVLEVDGNMVELKPNTSKPGNPLEFEHRDVAGNFVKWTTTIEKCDKPSLAGGVTPCGTSSRLSRIVKGNVEWIALARKTRGVARLDPEPYWLPGNPTYELLGYIGFNRVSGELAFFDGSYTGMRFNWNAPIVQPGGDGYSDETGRAASAMTYDATFRIGCTGCHDNKEPRIITPYIKQARVGYRSEERASAFSLGELLPALPRDMRKPYRVVGSGYTATHAETIRDTRTIVDPTRNCTSCHGLTSGGTAGFAADAVGRLGAGSVEDAFRTDWSLRAGDGKIHPWMLPFVGNNLSTEPPAPVLSDTDWNALKAVLESPDSDSRSLNVYTEAPAPEAVISDETRIADKSAPTDFSVAVADNRDGTTEQLAKEVQFSWKYLNDFGGIPERDDVRFHLAILEMDIPAGGGDSVSTDYPTIEQAKGVEATRIAGEVYRDGKLIILKDASFAGHLRWTDPAPTTSARQYRIAFPAAKNKRYLIRLVAKRHCFDQNELKYSGADHVLSVDVP